MNKQEARDLLRELMCNDEYDEALDMAIEALSAERTGEWVDAEIPLESGGSMPIQACNLCKTFYPLAFTGGGHRFCPNCGAKLHLLSGELKKDERIDNMSKELNCMNCSIGDFKHELCDCDNGFCKEFKSIGTQEDFFNAVMQRIRPQGEWIPVSERLPEKNGYYIVSLNYGVDPRASFDNGKWYYVAFDCVLKEYREHEVIAWMPLPEPYEGGDTE